MQSGTAVPTILGNIATALHHPLSDRIKKGEGGLWPMFGIACCITHPANLILWLLAGGVLLNSLYLFNDLHDAALDRANPKKDQRVVQMYLDHPGLFRGIFVLLALGLPALLLAVGSPREAGIVLALQLVNAVYSIRLKGIPFLDFAIVGLWGALYVAVALSHLWLILSAGLGTSVMHLYQAKQDVDVDRKADLITTAVQGVHSYRISTLLLCVAHTAVFAWYSGMDILATAVGALMLLPALWTSSTLGWHTTRLTFGAGWAWLFWQIYLT